MCFNFDDSVGKLEGELHLYTKEDVSLSKAAPREIPCVSKTNLLLKSKIFKNKALLKKVTEPTDWVSATTIVNKPSAKNAIRLCIYSRPLNMSILPEKQPERKSDESFYS